MKDSRCPATAAPAEFRLWLSARRFIERAGCYLLLALSMTGIASAQNSTQQISGFVKDPSSAGISSAKVTVTQAATGLARTAEINESGYFVVTNLPIGQFDVSVEAPGFRRFVKTGVIVDVNSKVSLDVTMVVGAVTDAITVTAGAAQVETSSAEIGRLVSGEQASQLQLNGRNFMQLVNLVPGVSSTAGSGFSLYGGYGSQTTYASVNGLRTDVLSVNVDGSDNLITGGGGLNAVAINPDAIAEFKMLTSNYSAEFGQNAGAVINVAVKSGTRDFHGSAYEFVRNDAFDARQYLAASKQELRFNNFGWTLGGPAYIPKKFNEDRTKLFFFSGMESKRIRTGSTNLWTVPTAAQRSGDFSATTSTQRPIDPLSGQPFAGGLVPANRISPNSLRLVQNYPLPNFSGVGGNYTFPTLTPLDSNQYLLKVDYNLSEKHQISFNFLHENLYTLQNLNQMITFERTAPSTNTSLKWTWVMNPSTVNTVQVSRPADVINQNNFEPNPLFIKDYTRAGAGINYPMLYGNNNSIPSISIAGLSGLTATPVNWNNQNRIYLLKDDFAKVLGSHTLKFGIWGEIQRKLQDNQPIVNGTFAFQTGHSLSSGNAIADALLGNYYTYTEAQGGRDGFFPYTQVEWYAADNWKVNRRLTLDFGIRFAYLQPQYVSLQNAPVFVPGFYNAAAAPQVDRATGQIVSGTGSAVNGLALGGDGFGSFAKSRLPSSILNSAAVQSMFHGLPLTMTPSFTKPGPRFGFAYDVTGKQQTVLRGGYGMTFERVQGNFVFGRINNPPFVQQATLYSGNVEDPAGGVGKQFPQAISSSSELDLKVPVIQNWSLGVQHAIDKDTLVDVAYVGSSAWSLYRARDLNALPLGTIQKNPGVNTNALRPYLGYAGIQQYLTGSNSIYNSLQVQVRKQFKSGGLVNASYTWSKAITDASSYSEAPMDNANFKADRSLASFDRRQIFVLSYVYSLPFWQHPTMWYRRALGGWAVSGIATLQSGRPLNLVISSDTAGTATGNQRPNLIGDWTVKPHAATTWFSPAAFALPAAGTYGNLGKNTIIGPGSNNWDLSLYKGVDIAGERLKAQIRLEAYNAPNHLQYSSVATTFGASNFGQVTGAMDQRIFQFGLKLLF